MKPVVPDPMLPEVIETVRLLLRPYRLGDVEQVFAYARDPEWSRFLRALPFPYRREHAEQFVARQVLLDRGMHPTWAITLGGQVIGGINLRFESGHRSAEMGYSVARDHWGRGVCTEAARAVVDAAYGVCGRLLRLQARADVHNLASQRVMEKIGMVKEGVLRSNRVERGEAIDDAVFSILRREWEAVGGG